MKLAKFEDLRLLKIVKNCAWYLKHGRIHIANTTFQSAGSNLFVDRR